MSTSSNQNTTPEAALRQGGSEQFSDLASKAPTRHPEATPNPHGAEVERDLVNQGKMPGLTEQQQQDGAKAREPGEVDAAGNKIHHKGVLGHVLHWEHDSMNADT